MSWSGKHQIAGGAAAGDRAHRGHRKDRVDAALLERPQVGAVVDAMRRNRVAVAVTREKHHVAPGDLAEDQGRRRLAIGRADDFAVGDGERRQSGKPAAADDGQHGMLVLQETE